MSVTLTIDSGSLNVEPIAPWSSIQTLTLGTSNSPTVISRNGPWVLVIASSTVNGGANDGTYSSFAYFQIQSSLHQVGDVVEVLRNSVNAWTGGTLLLSTAGTDYFIGSGYGSTAIYYQETVSNGTVRKVSSYQWLVAP